MKNSYYIKARLFPTVLTVLPILVLTIGIVAPLYKDVLKELHEQLPYLADFGLSTALIFLMVQINRFLAKEVFQRLYFQEEVRMPTTNHLLWSNDFFDQAVKEKIRSKILTLFGLTLLSENDEAMNEQKARRLIVTAVSQIRNKLRDNTLLLQHNIEYGFFRNLLGGCLIAVLCSLTILIYGGIGNHKSFVVTGATLLIIYFLPILLSSPIVRRYGNDYSKILYEQFLSL